MKLLVTGGAGFIASHFIRYILKKYPSYEIFNLDALTYSGNTENLADIVSHKNHIFIHGDICEYKTVKNIIQGGIDFIINFAAETHVDRSIKNADQFLKTNIIGVHHLLEAARKHGVKKFLQISTDEVYGALGNEGLFTESTPLSPNNPYSASKASADMLVLSYFRTHQLPVLITRSSNNYGPFQYPEKLIPLMTINALQNKPLPIYGDGKQIRDWIHVLDHCSAVDTVLHKGKIGEVYNIGGNNEVENIEVVTKILEILGLPKTHIQFVADRPGHDRRYATDSSKIRTLGWKPVIPFEKGLRETVQWYSNNSKWWLK